MAMPLSANVTVTQTPVSGTSGDAMFGDFNVGGMATAAAAATKSMPWVAIIAGVVLLIVFLWRRK